MQTLFGIDDDHEARERLGEVAKILEGASSPSTLLFQKDWPLLPYRAWLRAAERLYDWGARVVKQKREPGSETSSMLATLVALRDEDGSPAALEQLVGDAVTIYIVGHDSTSQQTTWALLMLAAHPQVQAEVREELARVLGGRAPTVSDELPALDAALNEAMRLLPATFALNPRIARRDLELDRNGVRRQVPRGAMAFGAVLAAHSDESTWSNATCFDPRRWSRAFKPEPYAFLPFGQGSRRRIGDMVAWHQMRAMAATLLQRHFLTPVSPSYEYEANVIQLKPVGPMKVALSRSAPARPKQAIGLRGNVAKDLVTSLS